jgi:hypothetical protein
MFILLICLQEVIANLKKICDKRLVLEHLTEQNITVHLL